MHVVHLWLLTDVVLMHRRYVDAIRAQRLGDGIHFVACKDEVTSGGSGIRAGGLEVEGRGDTHRRQQLMPDFGDGFRASDGVLDDAAVRSPAVAEYAVEHADVQ